MAREDEYRRWVERYVVAWQSNDPADIAALFSENGRYFTEPYAAPWEGREAIVRGWLDHKDEPGDTTFDYDVLVSTQEIGLVKGVTKYASSGKTYSNLWEIRLDASGDCTEFVEWWMERP
ncbi:MAG: nuclear transport factor 2 family protein [Actinomycetota bacterium]|nr:nuclear transport factor 2 family protein [Actinomycetota bacterium]